jgi:hypothetical protein
MDDSHLGYIFKNSQKKKKGTLRKKVASKYVHWGMGEFSATALRLSLTAQLQPAALLLLFPALHFSPPVVVAPAASFLFFGPVRQLPALRPSNSLLPNFFSLRLFFSPPPLSLDASLLPECS